MYTFAFKLWREPAFSATSMCVREPERDCDINVAVALDMMAGSFVITITKI